MGEKRSMKTKNNLGILANHFKCVAENYGKDSLLMRQWDNV